MLILVKITEFFERFFLKKNRVIRKIYVLKKGLHDV
jgi:hypothetical protein